MNHSGFTGHGIKCSQNFVAEVISAGKFLYLSNDLKMKLFIIRFKEEVTIKEMCIDRSITW